MCLCVCVCLHAGSSPPAPRPARRFHPLRHTHQTCTCQKQISGLPFSRTARTAPTSQLQLQPSRTSQPQHTARRSAGQRSCPGCLTSIQPWPVRLWLQLLRLAVTCTSCRQQVLMAACAVWRFRRGTLQGYQIYPSARDCVTNARTRRRAPLLLAVMLMTCLSASFARPIMTCPCGLCLRCAIWFSIVV